MNEILNQLKPEGVWRYFGEILRIPRPSKKEEKIREYLLAFGQEHGLETLQDETGNVLIRKPATPGMENRQGVILQSHMDMVCEKNADSKHNFDTDPIEVHIEDGWLKAKDTTLGADNGIGCAFELAVLADKTLVHGPLECLFTVDEETGLTGAFGLKPGFLRGKILLNLDSEDDGQFFIGCAGGIDTLAEVPVKTETRPAAHTKAYTLHVKGLKGGHSGDDINKGLGNANKFLVRFLCAQTDALGLRVSDLHGGNLRNAIAREASAVVCLPEDRVDGLLKAAETYEAVLKREFKTEPGLRFYAEAAELPATVWELDRHKRFCDAMFACPHGVLRMSSDIPNFVETSTNLASMHYEPENGLIRLSTSQRSSVESAKVAAAERIAACFRLIGADVRIHHSDGYPGWTPDPASPILKICTDTFRDLFHEEPLALAIHAGLECGLFATKYPGMDMVSYGPTMRGVHSPDERLLLDTVERCWRLTVEILKRIPVK